MSDDQIPIILHLNRGRKQFLLCNQTDIDEIKHKASLHDSLYLKYQKLKNIDNFIEILDASTEKDRSLIYFIKKYGVDRFNGYDILKDLMLFSRNIDEKEKMFNIATVDTAEIRSEKKLIKKIQSDQCKKYIELLKSQPLIISKYIPSYKKILYKPLDPRNITINYEKIDNNYDLTDIEKYDIIPMHDFYKIPNFRQINYRIRKLFKDTMKYFPNSKYRNIYQDFVLAVANSYTHSNTYMNYCKHMDDSKKIDFHHNFIAKYIRSLYYIYHKKTHYDSGNIGFIHIAYMLNRIRPYITDLNMDRVIDAFKPNDKTHFSITPKNYTKGDIVKTNAEFLNRFRKLHGGDLDSILSYCKPLRHHACDIYICGSAATYSVDHNANFEPGDIDIYVQCHGGFTHNLGNIALTFYQKILNNINYTLRKISDYKYHIINILTHKVIEIFTSKTVNINALVGNFYNDSVKVYYDIFKKNIVIFPWAIPTIRNHIIYNHHITYLGKKSLYHILSTGLKRGYKTYFHNQNKAMILENINNSLIHKIE